MLPDIKSCAFAILQSRILQFHLRLWSFFFFFELVNSGQKAWPLHSANKTDGKTLNIAGSCQLEMKEADGALWFSWRMDRSGSNLSGLDSENCAEEFHWSEIKL